MLIDITTYGLSFIAGVLSILSPCVLPLVPIIVGTALNTHRFGPYALALGLAISFTVIGVFLATLGDALGIDQELFREVAAWLLMLFGVVLLSARLQAGFVNITSGLGGSGQQLLDKLSTDSLLGQLGLGLVLGIIWSPCVGPILGATVTLASQGQQLGQVVMVMAIFGLGAGLPLILLGMLSRQVMMNIRGKLFAAGKLGKQVLGGVMLLIGIMILTGLDKQLESFLVAISPDWLITLSTRF
jgi:cytochrome c-type biogenesis protein